MLRLHTRIAAAGAAIGRRRVVAGLATLLLSSHWPFLRAGHALAQEAAVPPATYPQYDDAVASVLPEGGYTSRIVLGESVLKLVDLGVIDPQKFLAIYRDAGGVPRDLAQVLEAPSNDPIHPTLSNAGVYVNLLWPIGLANRLTGNTASPLNGDSLYNFASTGGWWLGKEENGGAYFNRFSIVKLTPPQEVLAIDVAQNTYRPCCDNSTFFQDCNHGSALFGLLQLGASQGLGGADLYREALMFNALWFPDVYVRTALYFKVFQGIAWADVDPQLVMGFDYSALGPWRENVDARIASMPNLIPEELRGARCGA